MKKRILFSILLCMFFDSQGQVFATPTRAESERDMALKQLKEATTMVASLQTQLAAAQAQVTALKTAGDPVILKAQLTGIQKERDSHVAAAASQIKIAQDLKSKLQDAQKQVTDAQVALAKMVQDRDQHAATSKIHQATVAKMQTEAQALTAKLQGLQQEIDKLKEQGAVAQAALDQERQKHQQTARDRDQARTDHAASQAALAQEQQEQRKTRDAHAAVQTVLAQEQQKHQQTAQDRDIHRTRAGQLQTDLDQERAAHQQAAQDRDTHRTRAGQLQTDLDQERAAHQQTVQDRDIHRTRVGQLQTDLDQERAAHQQTAQDRDTHRTRADQLQMDLDQERAAHQKELPALRPLSLENEEPRGQTPQKRNTLQQPESETTIQEEMRGIESNRANIKSEIKDFRPLWDLISNRIEKLETQEAMKRDFPRYFNEIAKAIAALNRPGYKNELNEYMKKAKHLLSERKYSDALRVLKKVERYVEVTITHLMSYTLALDKKIEEFQGDLREPRSSSRSPLSEGQSNVPGSEAPAAAPRDS
jgi:hypothetical protein